MNKSKKLKATEQSIAFFFTPPVTVVFFVSNY